MAQRAEERPRAGFPAIWRLPGVRGLWGRPENVDVRTDAGRSERAVGGLGLASGSGAGVGGSTESISSSARRRIITSQRIHPDPLSQQPEDAATRRQASAAPLAPIFTPLTRGGLGDLDPYAALPSLNRDIWPAVTQSVVFSDDPAQPSATHAAPADDWTTALGIGIPSKSQRSSASYLAPPPRRRAPGSGDASNSNSQGGSSKTDDSSRHPSNEDVVAVAAAAASSRKRLASNPNIGTYTSLARQELEASRAISNLAQKASGPRTPVASGSQYSHSSGDAGTQSSASTHGRLKRHSPPSSPIPAAPPGPSRPLRIKRRRAERERSEAVNSPDSIRTAAFGPAPSSRSKDALQRRYSSALLNEVDGGSGGSPSSARTSPSLYRAQSSPSLSGHAGRPSFGSSTGYAGGPESVKTKASEPRMRRYGSEDHLGGNGESTIEELDEIYEGDEGPTVDVLQGKKRKRKKSVPKDEALGSLNRSGSTGGTVDRRPWEYQVAERLLMAASSLSGRSNSHHSPSSYYEELSRSDSTAPPASLSSRSRSFFSLRRSGSQSMAASLRDSLHSGWSGRGGIRDAAGPRRSASVSGAGSSEERASQKLKPPALSRRGRIDDELPRTASAALVDFRDGPSLTAPRARFLGSPDFGSPETPSSPMSLLPGLATPGTGDSTDSDEFSWHDAVDDISDRLPPRGHVRAKSDDLITVKRSTSAAWVFDTPQRPSRSSGDSPSGYSWVQRSSRMLSSSPDLAPTTTIAMRPLQAWPEGSESADQTSDNAALDHSPSSGYSSQQYHVEIPIERLRTRSMIRATDDANFLSRTPQQLKKSWQRQQQRFTHRMGANTASMDSTRSRPSARTRAHSRSLSSPAGLPRNTFESMMLSLRRPEPEMSERGQHGIGSAGSTSGPHQLRETYIEESLVGPRVLRPKPSELWRSIWSASSLSSRGSMRDGQQPRLAARIPASLQLVPPNAWLFVFGFLFFPLWYVGCFYPSVSCPHARLPGSRAHPARQDAPEGSPAIEVLNEASSARSPRRGPGGPLSGWPARSPSLSSGSTHIPDFDAGSTAHRALGGFWTQVAPRVDIEAHQLHDAPMWAYQRAVHTWRLRCRIMAVIFPFAAIPLVIVITVLSREKIM